MSTHPAATPILPRPRARTRGARVVALLTGLGLSLVAAAAAADGPGVADTSRADEVATASSTSIAAELVRARDALAATGLRSDQIQRWLGEARRARDGQRAQCLHRVLSQAHAAERDLDATLGAAEQAASDPGSFELHRERLRVVGLRSEALLGEASTCGRAPPRRASVPTSYEVRMKAPPLPGDPGDRVWRMVRRVASSDPVPHTQ